MNIPAAEKTIQKHLLPHQVTAIIDDHACNPLKWLKTSGNNVSWECEKLPLHVVSVISWFGRICLPHVQRIVSLNTACPHEGHWILEVLNSMSSTLAMSWAAWVDSWLNSMLSFTGSSRIQISFEPTSIRSIIWFFASSPGNVLVVTSTSSVWISSIVETDCSQLPGAWSTSGMCFEPSWTSGKSSLFCLCSQKTRYVCARSGMLLLALPILAQRYLARWPWSFKSFEKYSICTIWCHTINAISRYCCVGHDCKRLRLPEFQSKILRFWQSYPEYCILSWFPRCYRRTFLWNCEIIMSSFLLWVISKRICRCQENSLTSFIFLLSSRNQSIFQNRLTVTWTSSVIQVLLPVLRN